MQLLSHMFKGHLVGSDLISQVTTIGRSQMTQPIYTATWSKYVLICSQNKQLVAVKHVIEHIDKHIGSTQFMLCVWLFWYNRATQP